MKTVMVDMSCTLIHHGHVRLLRTASAYGSVIVALTADAEIYKKKGYWPELNFNQRMEIISSIRYVDTVVPSNWLITNEFLIKHKVDILVHGEDNSNDIDCCELKIFPRTPDVSSSALRRASYEIYTGVKLAEDLGKER